MKNHPLLAGLSVLALLLVPGVAPAANRAKAASATKTSRAQAPARIDAVTGKGLKVQGKPASAGMALQFGARVSTDATTSATVLYSDRSQIILGSGSSVVIEKPSRADSQLTGLEYGQLRARVTRSTASDSKPHFYVRTHSLAMGVRGTEFDVATDAKGEKTELHTLEGQVEAGKDIKTVESGKGVMVSASEFVQSLKGKIEPPRKFDREQYIQQLQKSQPHLQQLSQDARQAATQTMQRAAGATDEARKQVAPVQAPQAPQAPQIPAVTPPPAPPAVPPAPKLPTAPANPFGR